MLDMDVSRKRVHRALLSHLGEQITLTFSIVYDNPAPCINSLVGMNYILEMGVGWCMIVSAERV